MVGSSHMNLTGSDPEYGAQTEALDMQNVNLRFDNHAILSNATALYVGVL